MTAPRPIARRTLLAGAGALLAAPAVHAQGQGQGQGQRQGPGQGGGQGGQGGGRPQGTGPGVALVIGNSKYQWEASLPNVRRDAPDIAKRFEAMGLKTQILQDANRAAMVQAIEAFGEQARGSRFAAFYFAGHGAAWVKDNYLVPVDADLSSPNSTQALVPVSAVGAATGRAAHRLVVYDNCRNNPADGWQQLETQRAAAVSDAARAALNLKSNSLILFSTAPGRVALDGPAGENSPFAAALMRQLDGQTVDLRGLGAALRRDLLIATEGRQVLWDLDTFQQSFVVAGARGRVAANSSSWARDPSKIIELTKAYAFVRDNGLPLPPGLIAHRSAGRDGQKAGSWQYMANFKGTPAPQCLVVMSAEEGRTAELIVSAKGDNGPYWRFVTGTIAGGRIEYRPRDGSAHFSFAWKDANSGTLTQQADLKGGARSQRLPYTAPFTRLD